MKLDYFSVAECNGHRIRIRSHLIGKILLNIVLKCASALFYAIRRLYLLTEKTQSRFQVLKGGFKGQYIKI